MRFYTHMVLKQRGASPGWVLVRGSHFLLVRVLIGISRRLDALIRFKALVGFTPEGLEFLATLLVGAMLYRGHKIRVRRAESAEYGVVRVLARYWTFHKGYAYNKSLFANST